MAEDKPPVDVRTAAEKFEGVTGVYRQWANFGIIGFMAFLAGYMVMWTVPNMQKATLDAMREERAAARDDMAKAMQHGNEASKGMWTQMSKVTDKLEEVRLTLAHGQKVSQSKQDETIELTSKVVEAVQATVPDAKATELKQAK